MPEHFTTEQLELRLTPVLESPKDGGTVELIVRRPAEGQRETLERAVLNTSDGLVGDRWKSKGSSKTDDGSAHPDMQITLMNSRAIEMVAGGKERWPLAGDQLFVDIDLSDENAPPGTKIQIGTVVLEVTPMPHTGCHKFIEWYGVDATRIVNSTYGCSLNLRGVNARVLEAGTIVIGDTVNKIQ